MSGIGDFFRAVWKEITEVFQLLVDWLLEVFEPGSGWVPKAIFGAVALVVVFLVARRGTKS